MKEEPIIFNGEMVRAILDGRQTMTRRVIRPQPTMALKCVLGSSLWVTDHPTKRAPFSCPFGSAHNEDQLWVRETLVKGAETCNVSKALYGATRTVVPSEFGICGTA